MVVLGSRPDCGSAEFEVRSLKGRVPSEAHSRRLVSLATCHSALSTSHSALRSRLDMFPVPAGWLMSAPCTTSRRCASLWRKADAARAWFGCDRGKLLTALMMRASKGPCGQSDPADVVSRRTDECTWADRRRHGVRPSAQVPKCLRCRSAEVPRCPSAQVPQVPKCAGAPVQRAPQRLRIGGSRR